MSNAILVPMQETGASSSLNQGGSVASSATIANSVLASDITTTGPGGKFPNALSFPGGVNGSNPYVTLGGNRTIGSASAAFSICEWLWLDSTSFNGELYCTTSGSLRIRFTSSTQLRIRINNIDHNVTISPAIPLDEWFHLCVVRNSSLNANVYIDGVLQASQPALDSSAPAFAYFGRDATTGNPTFKGRRADARAYNYDISAYLSDVMGDASSSFQPATFLDFNSANNTWNIPYPATVNAGDLLIAVIGWKPETTTVSIPSGWTDCGYGTFGTGAGVNGGASNVQACYKIADGSESGTLTFVNSGSATQCGAIVRYSIESGYTINDVNYVSGGSASAATTLSGDLDVIKDDLVLQFINSGRGNSSWSSEAVDAPDVGWWSSRERVEQNNSTSPATSLVISEHLASFGDSSATTIGYSTQASATNKVTVASRFRFVDSSSGVTVTPSPAAFKLSTVNPTIQLGSLDLSPTQSSFKLSTVNPTTVLGSLSLTPSVSIFKLATVNPTIVYGSISLSPSVSQFKLVTIDPTVLGGGTSVTPSASAFKLSTVNPTVRLGSISLSPTASTFKLSTVNPGIVLGSIVVAPVPLDFAIATIDPTVVIDTGSVTVAPSPANLKLLTANPGVVLGPLTLVPSPVGIVISTINPTVQLGSLALVPDPVLFRLLTAYQTLPAILEGFYDNFPEEGYSVTLRTQLAEFIALARDNDQFDIGSTFSIEETYLPYEELKNLSKNHPEGKLYISVLPNDEENRSRAHLAGTETGILVGFQKSGVTVKETAVVDELVTFIEQLKYTCRHIDIQGAYCWNRNEAMKDENGTPYGYADLTQSNLFHSYFVAYYTYYAL